MKRRAIADRHPAVILSFYFAAVALTLCTMHPLFLSLSLLCGFFNALLLRGPRHALKSAGVCLAVVLLAGCGNALFGSSGLTVAFCAFGHPVTLEAFCYGLCAGAMLAGVLQWFSCYRVAMSNDQFLALFGRVLPSTALLLSMVFRALPETIDRGAQIEAAQRALLGGEKGSARERFRRGVRVASVLMSWSMESSVETADSMRGRGYGERKRTRARHERFSGGDLALTAAVLAGAVFCAAVLLSPAGAYRFYPTLPPPLPGAPAAAAAAVLSLLLCVPLLLEGKETLLWMRYRS